jgi:hypothetical protein
MRLLGHFSNPSSSLQAIFNGLPDEPLEPTMPCQATVPAYRTKRLGNGVVQRAVVKVLAAAEGPMRLADIQAAVAVQLGQSVSKESASWCLRTGTQGSEPRFERVAYGCYRLARP